MRDGELAHFTDLHPGDALIPSTDHLAGAQLETERFAAVPRAVELRAVGERSHVVDGYRAPGDGLGAVARFDVLDLEGCRHGGPSSTASGAGSRAPRGRARRAARPWCGSTSGRCIHS